MDAICISESEKVLDGLRKMLESIVGVNGYLDSMHVELPVALFVVEIAKRVEDKDDWFVRGKWATIQAIESRIDEQMEKLCEHR